MTSDNTCFLVCVYVLWKHAKVKLKIDEINLSKIPVTSQFAIESMPKLF